MSSSEEEELTIPDNPPTKPPNIVTFYIKKSRPHEQRNNPHLPQNEITSRLRTKWKEELGKNAKNEFKRQHKKLMNRYKKLLDLYCEANPDFNPEEYYKKQKEDNDGSRGSRRSSRKRRRNNDEYEPLRVNGQFQMNAWGDNDRVSHNNKKRRLNNNDNSTSVVDKIFNGLKSKRGKINRKSRKGANGSEDITGTSLSGGHEPEPNEIHNMKEFIRNMKIWVREDWKLNREKKPTINCLKHLQHVTEELSKQKLHFTYLEQCNLLDALRDWIHPLPDKSLPAAKIREEIYRIVNKLELHKYELTDYFARNKERTEDENERNRSGGSKYDKMELDEEEDDINHNNNNNNWELKNKKSFAETVMNLWANEKETQENKRLLKVILRKWIYKISGSDTSYGEVREELRDQKNEIAQRNEALRINLNKRISTSNPKRAKIPIRPGYDFAIAPPSKIDTENLNNEPSNNRGESRNTFANRMKKISKSSGNSRYQVSITGRKV